jgi:glucose-6-phosphate isomerase
MESLGKGVDLEGRTVAQGLTVYGNKGSTDQHSFVQQLRDGRDDFFVTFVQVLSDETAPVEELESGISAGDHLLGFLLGTRAALQERGRPTLTLSLPDMGAPSLGATLALFERAVGIYAQLIGVNAYDQPGVEAGKQAAARLLSLQRSLLAAIDRSSGDGRTAAAWAATAGQPEEVEMAYKILERLGARGRLVHSPGSGPAEDRFGKTEALPR